MAGFRVVYSRGSFAFAIACESRDQALARAVAISSEAGVWHVQVEDDSGMRLILPDSTGATRYRVVPSPRPPAAKGAASRRSPPQK